MNGYNDPNMETYANAVKKGILRSLQILTDQKQFEEAIEGKRKRLIYEPIYENRRVSYGHGGSGVVKVVVGQRVAGAIIYDSKEEQEADERMRAGLAADEQVFRRMGQIISLEML